VFSFFFQNPGDGVYPLYPLYKCVCVCPLYISLPLYKCVCVCVCPLYISLPLYKCVCVCVCPLYISLLYQGINPCARYITSTLSRVGKVDRCTHRDQIFLLFKNGRHFTKKTFPWYLCEGKTGAIQVSILPGV